MTQLSYQASFDPYHTIFRFFQISYIVDYAELPIDTLRIIDYFLSFPYRLRMFSYKAEHRSYREIHKAYEKLKPYGDQPDDIIVFKRMEHSQKAALTTMSKAGFIDSKSYIDGRVVFTDQRLSKELSSRIKEICSSNTELYSLLKLLVSNYQLTGNNGLKKRSKLMEYRYDLV